MTDYRQAPRRTNDSPIAAARIAAGMTQQQLADAIHTTQAMIARWETGRRTPKVATLKRIADALGKKWTEIGEELE